jgi:transcriptional regulator with XRE-family HTH domain
MTTTTTPPWTLGDRLRKAREHAGVKQDEMALHLGLSRAALSGYERGTSPPKLAVLRVWALRCGVPLPWLQFGVDTDDLEPDGPDTLGQHSSSWKRLQLLRPRSITCEDDLSLAVTAA